MVGITRKRSPRFAWSIGLIALLAAVLVTGCGRRPDASGTPRATSAAPTVATSGAVSSSWTVTSLVPSNSADPLYGSGAYTRAASGDLVAWIDQIAQDGLDVAGAVWCQSVGASRPTKVWAAADREPEQLAVVDGRLFWVAGKSVGKSGDGWQTDLFTWRPGDGRPRILYSVREPYEITDVQVSGDRIMICTLDADDYEDCLPNVGYIADNDLPHQYRVLSLTHPGRAKTLALGSGGASAVLGDGFIAWTKADASRGSVRYAEFTGGLGLGPTHFLDRPVSGLTPTGAVVASNLETSGKRLVWIPRQWNGDATYGIATWRPGGAAPQLVPGSDEATAVVDWWFDRDRIAWRGDTLRVWRAGETTAQPVPEPAGVNIEPFLSGDRLAWTNVNQKTASISLLTWHVGDRQPELVWTGLQNGMERKDGGLWGIAFGNNIVFGALLTTHAAGEDSEFADTGLLLARRQ